MSNVTFDFRMSREGGNAPIQVEKIMKVHAEIEYVKDGKNIHSDICPPKCSSDGRKYEEYRKLIHEFLDEWLDESGGTGRFYIGAENFGEK